ncbi:ankyrin repeat-containing domain protein [Neurospora tetraspora]|uniref:Ankyrin repeat-containing domain protein n=1 Tax=Neurospora tetraspora TaxID=94610 RepID=A0AAE0JLC9_9PEZI|nr:ankyrin repeat-containing domain protein [Neurospora tetraspora]
MVSFMDLLPVETVSHIVQYLGTGDANRFGQTCKGAYIITNPIVYKDNVPTKTKRGPVTWGVVTRQLRVIEMAVVAGADLWATDWLSCYQYELGLTGRFDDQYEWWWGDEASMQGRGSPLHYAAMINNAEAAEYLLQNSARHPRGDLEKDWSIAMCPCEVVNHEEWDGGVRAFLPLHTAACHGNLDVARALLERGASASHHSDIYNNTLLHSLVHKGPNRLAMIKLIASQPDVDINARDDDEATPLELALYEPNNGKIIAKLVQLGAIDTLPPHANLLRRCFTDRDLGNALALLEAGVYSHDHLRPVVDGLFCALVNPVSYGQWTTTSNYGPLDSRARRVVREMPEELIARIVRIMIEKYDLDINTPLHDSRHTPLNFIIHLGNRTKLKFLVTLLINLGARLDVADQLGHNALVACLWASLESEEDIGLRAAPVGAMTLT